MDKTFEIQGVKLVVKKITIAQSAAISRYINQAVMGLEPEGKGALAMAADLLETLPGLARIIFAGQPGADKINWMQVDTDTLLEIKDAFEKKNPKTTRMLKDTLSSSALGALAAPTALLNAMGSIFSSTAPPTEAPPKPTTSGKTGATPN